MNAQGYGGCADKRGVGEGEKKKSYLEKKSKMYGVGRCTTSKSETPAPDPTG